MLFELRCDQRRREQGDKLPCRMVFRRCRRQDQNQAISSSQQRPHPQRGQAAHGESLVHKLDPARCQRLDFRTAPRVSRRQLRSGRHPPDDFGDRPQGAGFGRRGAEHASRLGHGQAIAAGSGRLSAQLFEQPWLDVFDPVPLQRLEAAERARALAQGRAKIARHGVGRHEVQQTAAQCLRQQFDPLDCIVNGYAEGSRMAGRFKPDPDVLLQFRAKFGRSLGQQAFARFDPLGPADTRML
ncbi:hypothetical protein D3C72_1379360 [compost metagenome]